MILLILLLLSLGGNLKANFFLPGTSYIHTRIEVMYKPECAIHQEKVRNIII